VNSGTSASRQLRAFAGLHLDAMHHRAERDVSKRKGVAFLDGRSLTGDNFISGLDVPRRDYVTALAILVKQQGDVGRAVRVVLEPLDDRRDSVLVPLEIDNAVVLTMTTTLMAGCDAASVVPTTALALLLEKRPVRLTLVQVVVHDLHYKSPTRRCRLFLYDCHLPCSRPIP
jgi:hypothetical protein